MDRGASQATVRGVAKSRTGLSQLINYYRTSLVAQMVKRLSTMWETRVLSPGWEDPLEKKMTIHSRTIA